MELYKGMNHKDIPVQRTCLREVSSQTCLCKFTRIFRKSLMWLVDVIWAT